MNPREILKAGIMSAIVKENNRVKCVFFDGKDSIFKLDLECVRAGK